MVTSPREFQSTTVPFTGGVYRAAGLRAIDGDTVDVLIDLGLNAYRTERVRVAGVNTPELHASDPTVRAQALAAQQFTAQHVEGQVFTVQTYKAGEEKYGRYLADIRFPDGSSLAALLIAAGLGVAFMV